MPKHDSIRTPLGRARGLGSSHSGFHHWWAERLHAVALIPLMLWLLISAALLSGEPYNVVRVWVSSPLSAVLLLLCTYNMFVHGWLGLSVVMEDYIEGKWVRMPMAFVIKGTLIFLGALCSFCIVKIALG